MKLYKPLFSIIVIIIQLILSLRDYYDYIQWGKANLELDGIINRIYLGDSLFLFVLIIGFYEILTKPSLYKTAIRIFLVCIVLGTQFSRLIPIEDFYFGVYNTAWFSAVVAVILILIRIGKYSIGKINNKKSVDNTANNLLRLHFLPEIHAYLLNSLLNGKILSDLSATQS